MNTKSPGRKIFNAVTGWPAVAAACLIAILATHSAVAAGNGKTGSGMIKQVIEKRENLVDVELIGVAEYEVTELFNEILKSAPGVVAARRYRFQLNPADPRSCRINWQVEIKDTTPFALESDLFKTIRGLAEPKSESQVPGLSIQSSAEALVILAEIKPWRASGKQI